MNPFSGLQPAVVWQLFGEITQIPRPSKKEGLIQAYLQGFADKYGLEYKRDSKGNIVIIRPAAPGREEEPAVILQSHMDMVCEKDAGVDFDFENDPIQPYVEDGWVKAKGTTLGADCGIGMALQMALLIDPELRLPRLEALFTVDEEQGLSGAMELGEDMLTGNRMINLDSEDEGEIFIGCAGGIDTIATFSFDPEPAPQEEYTYYIIGISGLTGGHSGDDIDKGRANSNKLLNRLLWNLDRSCGIRLSCMDGGNLRNAIPREAEACIGIPTGRVCRAQQLVTDMTKQILGEYQYSESGILIAFNRADTTPESVVPSVVQKRILDALYAVPHGVVSMSLSLPGLVETSTNLASVKMPRPGQIVVTTSQRSMVESAKRDIADRVLSTFELAGASVRQTDGYPGWTPDPASALVATAESVYQSLFNARPDIKAIHAGLECGLFLKKYPHLDIISFGPTIRDAHSPAERLEVSTVEKTWNYLYSLVQNL